MKIGRLWVRVSGEGRDCPYFERQSWSDVVADVPEEHVVDLAAETDNRWSILTDHGETFDLLERVEGDRDLHGHEVEPLD